MIKFLKALVIILVHGLISCTTKLKTDEKVITDSAIKDKAHDSSEITNRQDQYSIGNISDVKRINLPFGSPILVEHKFPAGFKTADVLAGDTSEYEHEKELTAVGNWHFELKNNPVFHTPQIVDTIFIDIAPRQREFFIDKKDVQKSIAHIFFRLPDIGKYECFYAMFGSCGSFILYDPAKKMAKVTVLYYESFGDFYYPFRYFYINDKYEIGIYEGFITEGSCGIRNTTNIRISVDGSVSEYPVEDKNNL